MSVEEFLLKVEKHLSSVPDKMKEFKKEFPLADEASKTWLMNCSHIIPFELFNEWKNLYAEKNTELIEYTKNNMNVIFGYINPCSKRLKECEDFYHNQGVNLSVSLGK